MPSISNFKTILPCPSSPFSSTSVFQRANSDSKTQRLHRTLKNKARYIRELKSKAKKYRNKISDLSEVEGICNNIFQNMSPLTRSFFMSQLRAAKRLPKGRRWTLHEKLTAVSLLKRSPRSYELLRRFLSLPSPTTLNRLLSKVPFHPGINEHLFQHLGRCLATLKEEERMCSLVFDEMSIREHVQYNFSFDGIDGIVDLGDLGRKGKIANHALIFMAQGVVGKWKQPVAYYFTQGNICSEELEFIIRGGH